MDAPGGQRKTGPADTRRRPPVPSKTRAARSEVSRELRYRVIATAIAALGGTLATIAFFAARDDLVARVAGTSRGVPALVVLLAFTAIAIIVVVHYGRRSAQLTVAYHDLHRATLQRERSEAALRESERFVRATLDAMDVMIAVLDADGVVMAVNRAWRRCADDLVGGDGACDVGTNYVALCEGVRDGRAEIAHRVAAGLREVMAGTRDGFALDSRVSEDEGRLLTHVTRFPGHGPLRLIVAHQHVTLEEPAEREPARAEARQADEAIRVPTLAPKPEGASEERFRTLAEAAPVGIFLADADGRATYTNPQWRGITGLVEDRGTTWIDAIHHEDRERVTGAWRELLAGPDVFDAEFRIRTPANDVRWVHVVAKPLASDSACAGGFVGFMLDVTRRRASEDRIHALAKDLAGRVEARTRERDRFFTLTPDLLCVARATTFTMVNPAFTDVLGYAANELIGRPYLELVHPGDRDATRSAAERLVGGERVVHLENRYRHRDGSWRWIAWIAVPESPDVVYMAGRDVTGRERARDELARLTTELRALYDDAPCGYHSLDADGVLVDVNETALRWLGYEREEVVGRRRFVDLLTDASRRRFTEASERLGERGCATDVELDAVRKDGTVLPVCLRITADTDAEGRVRGSRSSMLDATERRRAAERATALDDALAAHVAELEKANHELETFAHSVSHDLRAPLQAIDGLACALHEERGEQLGEAGKRHLGRIRENAGQMAHVIDGLLDLSRIGHRPLDRGPVDMGALAHAVVDDVRREQAEREVTVAVGALAPAIGDPAALRQALTSLIDNAFKYTGKVAHPCIDVGSVDHDGTTVYYVRDNGAGFDMRHAHKLFHVFERLHGPEDFDGTGIGLAVVQRVVERHGGRAWAESRVGEGATFFFTLGDPSAGEADATPSA